MADSGLEFESSLLDTTGIDLDDLGNLPDSVLKDALARFRQEDPEQTEIYAGFDSAI
jgi:FXSXX-COOH protein